jgi:hypothetical protein
LATGTVSQKVAEMAAEMISEISGYIEESGNREAM